MRLNALIAVLLLSFGAHAKGILFAEPAGVAGGYAQFARIFTTTVKPRHKGTTLGRVAVSVTSLERTRRELGAMKAQPDVLVTAHTLIAQAAVLEFPGLPVVLATMADPMQLGFAADGRGYRANVTGFTFHHHFEMKHLELLKQVAPRAKRVGVVADPYWRTELLSRRLLEESSQLFGFEVTIFEFGEGGDPQSLGRLPDSRSMDAWFVPDTPANRIHAAGISKAIRELSRPSIGGHGSHARNGGLMSYEPEQTDPWPRLARIVNQVLSGVAARDIAFDRPSLFRLVVNERAARAMGIALSPDLLRRAEEVIR